MPQQRSPNLRPGRIPVRVQNPIAAVRALARQHQLSRLAIEVCAPAQQLLDAQRPFLHQHPRRLPIHQAVARIHRILQMQRNVFLAAHRDGDSPLRIVCVRFVQRFLRHHQHAGAIRSQPDRGTQPRDARAHNHEVRFLDRSHKLSGYRIFSTRGTMQRPFARHRSTLRSPLPSAGSAASATPAVPDARDARHTQPARRGP